MHQLARAGLAFVLEERSLTSALSVSANLRLDGGGIADALTYFPELEPLLCHAPANRPKALLVGELSLGLAP